MPRRMSVWPTASHTRTPNRDRNHRRDNAFTTAAAKSARTEPGIRTRTLPANSSSIAGSRRPPFGRGNRRHLGRPRQHLRQAVRDSRGFPPPAMRTTQGRHRRDGPPR